jgi:hypothetical protein
MKGRDHSDDIEDEKIILKWIEGKQDGKLRTGCIWLSIGTGGGFL